MRIKDFDFYRALLQKESGLYLSSTKAYLLSSRLTPIAQKWEFVNLENMTDELRAFPDEKLLKDVVSAMTFTETQFFKNADLFTDLKNTIIPDIMKNKHGPRKFNIWCAGCSTGQEPYSLSILMQEESLKALLNGFKINIEGTDISETALQKATKGEYSQLEVQNGLQVKMLMTHFKQNDKSWTINSALQKNVSFYYHNLLDTKTMEGSYDLIFCRDVMKTDFDYTVKEKVLDDISEKLADYGYFIADEDDDILGFTDKFKAVENMNGVYVLNQSKK